MRADDLDKAREEWEQETADADRVGYPSLRERSGTTRCLVAKADALIAALEAENEALKAENERIRDLAGEYAPHLVIPKRRQP